MIGFPGLSLFSVSNLIFCVFVVQVSVYRIIVYNGDTHSILSMTPFVETLEGGRFSFKKDAFTKYTKSSIHDIKNIK